MTFTYVGTLATDLDKIRFKIQDTVSGSGVKPSGGNFTDEEIAGLLTIEGNVNRTVAALYEALAIAWGIYVDTRIGPRDEKLSQIPKFYAARAKEWRADYGYGSGTTLTSSFVTRKDGYSDSIDASETDSEDTWLYRS